MKKAHLLTAIALLAGCGHHLDVGEIAALENGVLVVEHGGTERGGIARVVRIDDASTSSTDVQLGLGATTLYARPGSPGEALVLTEGRLGDAKHEPASSELVRLDRTGEIGRWTFEGQYQTASPSRDGRYVVTLAPVGRLVVENRVEVADLTMPAGDHNPLSLSLRSLGGETPVAAELSTPIAWSDGADLRVAALFAAGQVSLFDLDAPETPPVTVPTTTDARAVGPVPVEGFFVGSELVVRASSGPQLLVLSLVPGTHAQRFDVAVRTLAASSAIRALAVDGRGSQPRVLALTAVGLDVFDLDTGMSAQVPLPSVYDAILLFDGPAPGDTMSRPRVALHGTASSIAFVDLGARPTEVLGSFVLPLSFQPDEVVADPVAGRLAVFERLGRAPADLDVASSSGRRPVSVVDLFDRSALALAASGDLSRAVVSTDLHDMWVAGTDGYVNHFDLDSERQEELWLEHSAESLLPLLGDAQRVIAFTDVRTGAFAVLQAGTAARVAKDMW